MCGSYLYAPSPRLPPGRNNYRTTELQKLALSQMNKTNVNIYTHNIKIAARSVHGNAFARRLSGRVLLCACGQIGESLYMLETVSVCVPNQMKIAYRRICCVCWHGACMFASDLNEEWFHRSANALTTVFALLYWTRQLRTSSSIKSCIHYSNIFYISIHIRLQFN